MSDTYSVIYSPKAKDDLRILTSPTICRHRKQQRAKSTVSGKKSGRWILCRLAMLS